MLLSHPCRDEAASWMGHPDWVIVEGIPGLARPGAPKCGAVLFVMDYL